MDERDDEYDDDPCGCGEDDCPQCSPACHYCRGEGWGFVGTDWDAADPVNGPYPGEAEECPCCGGSGRAKDCTFW